MKVLRNIILMYTLLCGFVPTAWPLVFFGSKEAGFVIPTGSTVDFNGVSLNSGTLYKTGGTIVGDDTSTCSQLGIVTKHGQTYSSVVVDGVVDFDGVYTLGNNQRFLMNGGALNHSITVTAGTASPAILQGYGTITSDITLSANSQLNMRWASPLRLNIVVDGSDSVVKLEQNLSFGAGYGFTGSAVVVDCNNYTLSLGGDEVTDILTSISIDHPMIVVRGMLDLNDGYNLTFLSSGIVNAHGNTINLGDNSFLNSGDNNITLNNAVFSDVTSSSFQGSGSWYLNDVTFKNGTNALSVTGQMSGNSSFFASGTTRFFDNTYLSLENNCVLTGTWEFSASSSEAHLNGNNYILDLSNGTIVLLGTTILHDIVLNGVGQAAFDNSDDQYLWLSNVTWLSLANGGVRINPLMNSDDPIISYASCWLSDVAADGSTLSTAQGNIFTNVSTEWSNASIELLTDVALGSVGNAYRSTWYMSESTIDGAGKVFDMQYGKFVVANGTLTLRNIVLENVNSNSFADAEGVVNAEVSLSNVTIKLLEDTDFSALNVSFHVEGPVTFVTGAHTFTVNDSSLIIGVTARYDTLSAADANNVQGFDFLNDGRLLFVENPTGGDIYIEQTGTVYLGRTEYLAVGTNDIAGRTIAFDATGTTTYDGLGRSLVFPLTEDTVLSVGAATTVKTENLTLEGLLPSHLDVSGSLYFGNNTVIRLTQDWNLDQIIQFGTDSSATNEEMMLDLNGFMIDLHDSNAAILLQGSSGAVLRICNGRLLNLSGTKLAVLNNGGKLIFENVECVLSEESQGNYRFGAGEGSVDATLEIQGRCSITGRPGNIFYSESNGDTIIASGATWRIMYNLGYVHSTLADFECVDGSSTVELVGALFGTMDRGEAGPLVLPIGTIVADHKSVINVGDAGITLGNGTTEVDLIIRPGATISVTGSGTLLYQTQV